MAGPSDDGPRCASHEVCHMTGPDACRQIDRTPSLGGSAVSEHAEVLRRDWARKAHRAVCAPSRVEVDHEGRLIFICQLVGVCGWRSGPGSCWEAESAGSPPFLATDVEVHPGGRGGQRRRRSSRRRPRRRSSYVAGDEMEWLARPCGPDRRGGRHRDVPVNAVDHSRMPACSELGRSWPSVRSTDGARLLPLPRRAR
jgi:hypothetical protein